VVFLYLLLSHILLELNDEMFAYIMSEKVSKFAIFTIKDYLYTYKMSSPVLIIIESIEWVTWLAETGSKKFINARSSFDTMFINQFNGWNIFVLE
jgi:hypothetical protein